MLIKVDERRGTAAAEKTPTTPTEYNRKTPILIHIIITVDVLMHFPQWHGIPSGISLLCLLLWSIAVTTTQPCAGCHCSCYRYHSLVSFRFKAHLKIHNATAQIVYMLNDIALERSTESTGKNGLCMNATSCRCARKKIHFTRCIEINKFVNKMCKMRKLSSGFELEFLLCIGVYYSCLKPFL